jgi:hypothetical protein
MRLGSNLVRFAERHNIPMVTTLLSKSTSMNIILCSLGFIVEVKQQKIQSVN